MIIGKNITLVSLGEEQFLVAKQNFSAAPSKAIQLTQNNFPYRLFFDLAELAEKFPNYILNNISVPNMLKDIINLQNPITLKDVDHTSKFRNLGQTLQTKYMRLSHKDAVILRHESPNRTPFPYEPKNDPVLQFTSGVIEQIIHQHAQNPYEHDGSTPHVVRMKNKLHISSQNNFVRNAQGPFAYEVLTFFQRDQGLPDGHDRILNTTTVKPHNVFTRIYNKKEDFVNAFFNFENS